MQLIRKTHRKGETSGAYESEDARMGTLVESNTSDLGLEFGDHLLEVTVIRNERELHTKDKESIRTQATEVSIGGGGHWLGIAARSP
ncbi:hypothetical protein ACFX1W_043576 [Malus domestica]